MKRLIAFSSVAHMGFVMLGIATLTTFGINAAIFGMVAHGLITGMLFFIAGSVQHNYGTRELCPARRPAEAGAEDGLDPRLLRDGSASGCPASRASGVSSRRCCRRSIPAAASPKRCSARTWSIAAVGTVLAAGYLLWMLQKVAFGEPKPEFARRAHPRCNAFEWTPGCRSSC